ncbi:MAG: tetratricopeptide repeat protein [Candidatus Tectomicrobia bacterium]|uniref:Tetratricopeptide repeat protein n=1 Tax=Tectimicrobiota bacterium TaxID=2528274 RepID=A0A932GPQ2_UNCTE|nr:tetratricopeptide repeat protein [Candidatus Tectomicrobia bacterium]
MLLPHQVRERFASLTQSPDESIDLARGALLIAQEEYPDLEINHYIRMLDDMALEVQARLPANQGPGQVIDVINQYLFDEMAFSGNREDYYNPKNSFLNEVLDTRLGIPITLSIIYLELGWRLGLPLVGVGLPGHFIVGCKEDEGELLIDPYNAGSFLSAEDCQQRLDQIYGGVLSLRPEYLSALPRKGILIRILNNLKSIYISRREHAKALAASERILLLDPESAHELRDRGLLFAQTGLFARAIADLEAYLQMLPPFTSGTDVERIRKNLEVMKKFLDI